MTDVTGLLHHHPRPSNTAATAWQSSVSRRGTRSRGSFYAELTPGSNVHVRLASVLRRDSKRLSLPAQPEYLQTPVPSPVSPFSATHVPVPVTGRGSRPCPLSWSAGSEDFCPGARSCGLTGAELPGAAAPLCRLGLSGHHSQVFQRPGQHVAGSGDTSSCECPCARGAPHAHCSGCTAFPVERGQRKGCASAQHRLSHSEVRPRAACRWQRNRCGSWADRSCTATV